MSNIIYVSPDKVKYFWPRCRDLIISGLATSEESSIDIIYEDLLKDKALLIVQLGEDGGVCFALVVRFVNMPNIRVAWIISIGGTGVVKSQDEWADFKNKIKNIGGASKIKAVAKNAQAKLWKRMGFLNIASIIEFSM